MSNIILLRKQAHFHRVSRHETVRSTSLVSVVGRQRCCLVEVGLPPLRPVVENAG
jgi:hypothetical protein